MDYVTNVSYALESYNKAKTTELTTMDIKMLTVLSRATRGTPAMKLREYVQEGRKIFSAVFNRAINRLIALKYITRTKHTKWVYYTITLKGRSAIAQLNESLSQIVNEQLAKLYKNA